MKEKIKGIIKTIEEMFRSDDENETNYYLNELIYSKYN